MTTYLPELSVSSLVNALVSQDWTAVEEELDTQQYERLGLDRALAIASDLLARGESLQGLRILDIGTNNGLIAKTLAALQCSVVGIDNGDVDRQGLYSGLLNQTQSPEFEFHRADLAEFLKLDSRHWDCILLLSVTHHWETGYAMSGERRYSETEIKCLLEMLFHRARLSIYYECPTNEPGFAPGFGFDFLLRHCRDLPKARHLGHSIGPNGYLRDLFALDVD